MPEVAITSSEAAAGIGVLDLLVRLGFCKSKNEARNKVTEGAVSIGPDRTKVNDPKAVISLQDGLVVRLGAKKIARVRVR
jgi:tyrosyl-tRNA synthetase